MDDVRYEAWRDGLSTADQQEIERIAEMPTKMALGYVYTELNRRIEDLHKPLWKQAVAPFAVTGAFVAGWLGIDPREFGG